VHFVCRYGDLNGTFAGHVLTVGMCIFYESCHILTNPWKNHVFCHVLYSMMTMWPKESGNIFSTSVSLKQRRSCSWRGLKNGQRKEKFSTFNPHNLLPSSLSILSLAPFLLPTLHPSLHPSIYSLFLPIRCRQHTIITNHI